MAFFSRLRHFLLMRIKLMKIKCRLFFIFMLASAGTYRIFALDAISGVLTVDKAVQIALDNNLNLMRSSLDVQTKKRISDRSWNSVLPTLSAAGVASHPSSVTGPIEPKSLDVWTSGFSLSAGLTFSVSVVDSIKKARADYEMGLLSYEAARQELELSIRKLFYQILLLDANRELAAANFASAEERYEQSAALARLGQAPRLDELSARVDMENMRPALRNAGILYENALDSFKTILGFPQDTVIRLDGSLSDGITGSISEGRFNSSESWPPKDALHLTESWEAANLRKSIQSLESQRNGIRNGAYVPNLRLSWTSTPLYSSQNKIWNDNGSFSVSLGLNLDNFLPWSSTKTQVDNLDDSIRSAQIQLSDTLRNQENRVSQNMRTVEGILESFEAMKFNVELAQSTYDMYEDAYKKGAADYQQLRSAGDSFEQAKNRLLSEQYNLISGLLDLENELNVPFGSLWN